MTDVVLGNMIHATQAMQVYNLQSDQIFNTYRPALDSNQKLILFLVKIYYIELILIVGMPNSPNLSYGESLVTRTT